MAITLFRDKYFFLSNFYPSPITYEGKVWPTVEHAFAAAKSTNPEAKERIHKASSPGNAKRLGRSQIVKLREDWEQVKESVMEELIALKFARGSELAAKLLATGDDELIEGNTWNDTYWGMCNGRGKNKLGHILMNQRRHLQDKEEAMPTGKVVHCKKEPFDVYIGRPSKWGNPFSHQSGTLAQFRVNTREEAIAAYEEWIKTQPQLMAALPELKGKVLGCWCAPQACHGEVLYRLANQEESMTTTQNVPRDLVQHHKSLWALQESRQTAFESHQYNSDYRIVTQNMQKLSTEVAQENVAFCKQPGCRLSWIFFQGAYYAKVEETRDSIRVIRLKDNSVAYEEKK